LDLLNSCLPSPASSSDQHEHLPVKQEKPKHEAVSLKRNVRSSRNNNYSKFGSTATTTPTTRNNINNNNKKGE